MAVHHIFISHSWSYGDAYDRLIDFGLTGASRLDPPVKLGGDNKDAPWVKTLWTRYQT